MARRRGFFAELQHQLRMREREQQRILQRQQRLEAQAAREQQRAVKAAELASARAAKEQQVRYVEQRRAYAAHRTRMVRERVEELASLLASYVPTEVLWPTDLLRSEFQPRPFTPGPELAAASPAPVWEQFAPPAPTGWQRVRSSGYQRQVEQKRADFEEALAQHMSREEHRMAAWDAAVRSHEAAERVRAEEVEQSNAQLEVLRQRFEAADPAAVEECFEVFLKAAGLPVDLPIDVEVAYQSQPRRLLIDRRLPGIEVIPPEREYRYVRERDEIVSSARSPKEVQQRYADLLGRLVLLTMRDAFAVRPGSLVEEVAVNGVVAGRNKATGRPEDHVLISVSATRAQFEDLVLTELDPVACLQQHLNAIVSPHPWDLEPVRPIFDPDLSRYKRADSVDVASQLDSRPVLVEMPWKDFEQLVRELFEAIGMQSWVTQPSKDDGVDAIAINPDPVMGGECVIQAKRYIKVVEIDAVRALAGVMEDKHASRGVLVTTSWFGKASDDFARRHNRIQLIDGAQLKYLIKEHLGKDVIPGAIKPSRRRGPSTRS
jgi:restriction system protein